MGNGQWVMVNEIERHRHNLMPLPFQRRAKISPGYAAGRLNLKIPDKVSEP